MSLRDKHIILDLRVYEIQQVSREHGRKRRDELMANGVIAPIVTSTGRCLLSMRDAEKLADALER